MSDTVPDVEEEVLTDLAHKLVDQVALYGLARDVAHDARVIAAIQLAKQARAELLQDINAKIWLRGIPAIDQGTRLGTAHTPFVRLRAVVGKDDFAAIETVERGEDYLRDRIAKAVNDDRLTVHTRNYLQTLVTRIERTHEEIRKLMDEIQHGASAATR